MKHLKLFIVISLSSFFSLQSSFVHACLWMDTHNYYLFNVCSSTEFSDRVHKTSEDNWIAYLGTDSTEYFWFDADRIAEAATARGDALMASYVRNLQKYLDCASSVSAEQWDYPTKEELNERNSTLAGIRLYAQGKLRTRLRSQHALLFMRCNMLLGRHQENADFWEQTASQYIETVYKEMMQNIYAGALLRTGRADMAAAIYAGQGDWKSLMTMFYQKRSYAAISAEYERDPNSPVLPFLLQDFVNNTQEAADANYSDISIGGKLFIRDISRAEATQMCQLAEKAVAEGLSRQPILWQSARAWIEFLMGQKEQAVADIQRALGLEGTQRQKDNARALAFYIQTATQKSVNGKSFDDYVATELTWLEEKSSEDSFFARVEDRTVHQLLADHYAAAGRGETALAIYAATQSPEYHAALDTINVDALLRYIDYATSPATTALDAFLKPRLHPDQTEMNDLVGTKYLRLCQWDEAARYLAKVQPAFYEGRGYATYAATRRTDIEPWITRQWDNDEDEEVETSMQNNRKLDFAREMQQLESGIRLLKGTARQQRCYDLAVRYAQAHYSGDCWWLMRNAKSVYDTVRVNETDLRLRAVDLLRQTAKGKDLNLRERALFALAYVYMNPDVWYEANWDYDLQENVRTPLPATVHYAAWTALADFERKNKNGPAPYVSRCDEYKQFMKQYR